MELLFSRRDGISGSLYCIIPFKAKKGLGHSLLSGVTELFVMLS